MSTIIPMPIEKREPPEPPQPIDERERWVNVAFCAVAVVAIPDSYWSTEARQAHLRALLETNFSDVPDAMPSPDDIPAFARFAMKRLLKALTADNETRQRAEKIADAVFEEMVLEGDKP
jgi:hypothetical protein